MSEPDWGGRNGIWYPLVWRALDLQRWWPAARFLKGAERDSVPVDIYLGVMWLLEFAVALGLTLKTCALMAALALAFATYRIVDIILVLLSELLRGAYVSVPRGWVSANRKVLLTLVNALKLFLLFGVIYFSRELMWLRGSDVEMGLADFGDAFYFSIVTGTTLGYDDIVPHADDNIGRALISIQPVIFVLVVVAMLGFARGRGETQPPESIVESDRNEH